jgi:hypothetical protein
MFRVSVFVNFESSPGIRLTRSPARHSLTFVFCVQAGTDSCHANQIRSFAFASKRRRAYLQPRDSTALFFCARRSRIHPPALGASVHEIAAISHTSILAVSSQSVVILLLNPIKYFANFANSLAKELTVTFSA